MAEDGTTPPSGEDLLSSIRRLVAVREPEALVLTGAQRIEPEPDPVSEDDEPPAWLTRINTATAPDHQPDDPFAHRAPGSRPEDESWPALSKESLGLVPAGMTYSSDDFEEDEEPVWSGSVMRHPRPPASEPEPESEPFLLTDPDTTVPPEPLALTEPAEPEPPLTLTDRVASDDTQWDDVDKLAERLGTLDHDTSAQSDDATAPAPPDSADLAAQIEAAVALDLGLTDIDPAPEPEPAAEPQAPAVADTSLPPALADEELNALVSAIIREELRGELGMRITRNVRKLVRREIYRAIANGEFSRE